MPALILTLLSLPIALAITFYLNISNHLMQRTEEQNRLDAFTLSICHTRKNFIENEIESTNEKIKYVQYAMDAAVYVCMAATAVGLPIACEYTRNILKIQSAIGSVLEVKQNLNRISFALRFRKLFGELRTKNRLTSKEGDLFPPFPPLVTLMDGFSREELNEFRTTAEKTFGSTWPKKLEPNDSFNFFNHFQYTFSPVRDLIGVSKPPTQKSKWEGFKVFKLKARSRSSISQSGCSIDKEEYELERTK